MPEKNQRSFLTARIIAFAAFSILLSGIVRALAIFMFTTPNEFAPGGIIGIAVLLEALTGLNSGYFLIMLNVPLFFVAFFLIGKFGAVVSTLSMLFTSGLLIVFDYIPGMEYLCYSPDYNAILAAIAGGVLLGVALAVTIKSCGTSGGTTVLASLVNKKYRNLSVSAMTSVFDACVVLASFFVYHQGEPFAVKLDPVLLALVSLFVTELHATGMYSHQDRSVLVCVIRKRQIGEVQRILRNYPETFASFAPVSEVYGKFLK